VVKVGEPAQLDVEFCCTNPSGCGVQTFRADVDGVRIIDTEWNITGDFCDYLSVGTLATVGDVDEFDDNEMFDSGSGFPAELIINEPGEYQLTLDAPDTTKTHTLTVKEPPIDSNLVSVDCSTSPDRITLGETTTVAATISNDNDSAVTVDVTFELADATETVTVGVGGGGTEQAEVTFEPEDTGEYAPGIEYAVV